MKRYLRSYIKEHGYVLMLAFLAPVLFLLVFCLYHMDLRPLWYASYLYELMWLIVSGVSFSSYMRQCKECEALEKRIQVPGMDLPEPKWYTDKVYIRMIRALNDRISTLESEYALNCSETEAYYTMWVHQIKTPIAAMRMLLQTEDTTHSRMLEGELFRVEQYADMALNYIRLEESGNDFVFRECALDPIIRKVIRKFASQFITGRIKLNYIPTDICVVTDEKWLSFILEQFLSNAIKYTPSGTIDISVSEDEILTVTDTGIGIAPQDLPRIFEKGFTGQNGRNDLKATGLGLYLCRRAAERLHVRLFAESVQGQGSSFSLALAKKRTGEE